MTTQTDRPQICLITPAHFEVDSFAPLLAAALDAVPVACLRLALATADEDRISRAADAVRELAHARDVPVVIERHSLLVERLGLDGVHLPRGAGGIRKLRADLGADAIIGIDGGNLRHDGINAAEAGADYVSFGPVGETALGSGQRAGHELFSWWSEMIELPVMAEGALNVDLVREFAPVSDFFAFGDDVWATPDPLATLRALAAAMG
jgi:thiamine-phosphate pyrophosphorylase